jgi:hypothetical protein
VPYKSIVDKRKNDRRAWLKLKAQGTAGQTPIGVVKDLGIKVPKDGLKIAPIPDVQAMPGVPMEHLTWCGKYLADKQPDVIMCVGDFGDFPSLSHFDRGTLQFEGRRYKKDLDAFHRAMELLMNPIQRGNWKPRLEFTMGNHEDHIRRAVNEDPKLEGLMSTDDLRLADYGWRVHEFLQPVSIGGVAFCHYFPSGVMGRPITTAQALLTKLHMSAFAGHQQGRQIAYGKRADGADMTAIISGSFYQHSYEYLSPFTNRHWRGFYMLHEVRDGQFDEMAVSIDFLRRRYGA